MDAFLNACELHSEAGLRAALAAGLDVRAPLGGKRPVEWLLEMYTRSDRFAACLARLIDAGAQLPDPRLRAVLLDDGAAVAAAVRADSGLLACRIDMRCAFTPLAGASLLHVAAEYGHLHAARALLAAGANVDARAAVDAHGLGGHTPLFHTVNSHGNRSLPVAELLLGAGADAGARVDGLTWGQGLEWETTLFDLTPLSYAQAGLLPQMHRAERDVDAAVRLLLKASGRAVPPMLNVPNGYVAASKPG